MKFFRATETAYEQARNALDAALGLPDGRGTQTCVEPVATALRDVEELILFALSAQFCAGNPAMTVLAQFIADGAIAEIDFNTYRETRLPSDV